ncbi:MAG TPA: hypothetical protein PL196_04515, partial [Burkholderiaceae bacterium]|nr:hypothetical protein [Burkholderiaceae bacterium]
MDRRDTRSALLARTLAAGLLTLAAFAADSRPVAVNAAGAVVVAPGYGGRWVGGPYRPWVGPGWRYGYPGWGYAG